MKRVLLLLLTALFGACQKSDPIPTSSLPPATSNGAETLGFLVDNQPWVPAGRTCGIYGCTDNRVEASAYADARGRRHLLLTAMRTDGGRNEAFQLQIDSLAGPGVYRATAGGPTATGGEPGTRLYWTDSRQRREYQSQPGTATITITRVDTVQSIVAGTFEGQLPRLGSSGSVQLSSGRFDVRYNR